MNDDVLAAGREHFNALNELLPALYGDASRFVRYCHDVLSVNPQTGDFSGDFDAIIKSQKS